MLGKFAGRAHVGQLHPDDLHLIEADFRRRPVAGRRPTMAWPLGSTHCAIACPPCAQSTIATRADFSESSSAICLKREYSIVALDMLIETRPIFPSEAGLPSASSGTIRLGHFSRRRQMPGRRFVLPAAVQAAVFSLVLVVGRHLGKRLKARRRLAAGIRRPRRLFRRLAGGLVTAELQFPDRRRSRNHLDRQCHRRPLLQLRRLHPVSQRLAIKTENFRVRGNRNFPVLSARIHKQDALVGIHAVDGANSLERVGAGCRRSAASRAPPEKFVSQHRFHPELGA